MGIDAFTEKQDLAMLTTRQTAKYLAISPRKLWEMTKLNQIPHVRLSRCVRYSLVDPQRWIEAQRQGGNLL